MTRLALIFAMMADPTRDAMGQLYHSPLHQPAVVMPPPTSRGVMKSRRHAAKQRNRKRARRLGHA